MFDQKKDFYLGLSVGVAAVSSLAFIIMSVAYFQKSGGAVVDDEVEIKKEKIEIKKEADNGRPEEPSAKADIKIKNSDYIRGNKKAPITIVEFSDIQCPFCSRFHDTMKEVMANYDGQVRWVFRHFPLESIHPYAKKAAEASECAGEQGKFWEYIDEAYANQASLSDGYISEIAKKIGLNEKKFGSCLSDGKYADKVKSDLREGQSLGVNGTPASFINGRLVSGAQPYEEIKKVLDSLK